MITIAREGLEDKYGLQLNPGEGVGPGPPGGARPSAVRGQLPREVGLVWAGIILASGL